MGTATYRITGTRAIGSTIEFDSGIVITNYPSPTTWEADILLDPDVTEYSYRFESRSGVFSPWVSVAPPVKKSTPGPKQARNTIDLWGSRLDTERLTGESNVAYRDRLLDVFVHRGNATHPGLLNAIARDLSLSYSDTALIINAKNSTVSGLRFNNVRMSISSLYVRVYHPDLVVHDELALVNPITMVVVPSKQVCTNLRVLLEDGSPVEIKYDENRNEIFVYGDYGSRKVRLSYVYNHRVALTGKTVQELADELEALESPAGDLLIDVTVDSDYASNTAEKLQKIPEVTILETHFDAAGNEVEGLPVRWADLKIEPVWDTEIQDSLRTWTGSLWNTKIDSAFQALVNLSKQTWGTAVADDSVWGSHDFPLHGGQNMDTVYDAPLGYWENPITGDRFDRWQAALGTDPVTGATLIYKGITRTDCQSGVGSGSNLKVRIRSYGYDPEVTEREHNTSDGSEGEIPTDDPMLGIVDLPS